MHGPLSPRQSSTQAARASPGGRRRAGHTIVCVVRRVVSDLMRSISSVTASCLGTTVRETVSGQRWTALAPRCSRLELCRHAQLQILAPERRDELDADRQAARGLPDRQADHRLSGDADGAAKHQMRSNRLDNYERAIETYAAYLAGLPQVDPTRIGMFGIHDACDAARIPGSSSRLRVCRRRGINIVGRDS